MTRDDERKKLLSSIFKDLNEVIKSEDYQVISSSELESWKLLFKKYEFAISSLYMIAKKPISQDSNQDSQEVRSFAETSIERIIEGKIATIFDDLKLSIQSMRIELIRMKVWQLKAIDIFKKISSSECLDSKTSSDIKHMLDSESFLK